MPLQRCQTNGIAGWKWGRSGKCYTGAGAKKKALRQAAAIRAGGFTENQSRLFSSLVGLLEESEPNLHDVETLAERVTSLVTASVHGKRLVMRRRRKKKKARASSHV